MGLLADWCTDEVAEYMRLLLSQGDSYGEIASKVNARFNTALTRNSVLGKCRRLGMASKNKRTDKVKPGRKKDVINIPKFLFGAEPPKKPMPKERPPSDPNWVEPAGIDVRELTDGVCHWPLGGFSARPPYKYCGMAKYDNKSKYCSHHLELSKRSNERKTK
jgi:GcrA cell cycle regulator